MRAALNVLYYSDIHIEIRENRELPVWTDVLPLGLGPDLSGITDSVNLVVLAGDIGRMRSSRKASPLTYAAKVALEKAGTLIHYLEFHPDAVFIPIEDYPQDGHAVWRIPAEAAFPCATQNELTASDAKAMLANGVICVSEGANMPCTSGAVQRFLQARIAYGPGKAANAGGVATRQLEMQQNAGLTRWPKESVDRLLRQIMKDIHRRSSETAAEFGEPGNLVLGANIAGFRRVADAMIEHGID